MKPIGRRLTVAFDTNSFITLEKSLVKPDFFKGNFEDYSKEGHLEHVIEILGERQHRYHGKPVGNTYGHDVNWLISNNDCWLTEKEWDQIYKNGYN